MLMCEILDLLGDISLEDILHRIYFERCSYDDLREYVPLALQSVPDLETFLDILYTSIRDFALVIFYLHFIVNLNLEGKRLYIDKTLRYSNQS